MVPNRTLITCLATVALVFASVPALARPQAAVQSTSEQPVASTGPARSKSETIALGYLRTLQVAQKEYKKKRNDYATTLKALIGKGSFTRRMAATDRGEYTVEFRSNGKEYSVSLVPKQFDYEHRAFFMDESGVIRVEEETVATADSPPRPKNGRSRLRALVSSSESR
jgi:hypothetical protein